MGYYMRYFADAPLALGSIKQGLVAEDPLFKIDGGELSRGDAMLAELEINLPGTDLYDGELAAMLGRVESSRQPNARYVIERLRNAKSLVAIQVLHNGRDPQQTFTLIAPIWSTLARLSTGMSQADGDGFYENGQKVLEVP